ncbi:hypothetical protein K456DRAFT_364460 [Colletotrichum gloeosporioides 23]|nr:hypothetical protein K456DRAFT_364460 [Colletotrichum gloeosporioides 23]
MCKMDLANSKRCGECVKRGFSNCDGGDVANALNRCFTEQKKVEREEEEAEEALEVLQTQLAAALGRLSRLRRHKRFLKERGADLIRRGMQSVDEWEAEERALEAQESRVMEDLSLWGAQNESDWPSLGTGFVDLGIPPNVGSSGAS